MTDIRGCQEEEQDLMEQVEAASGRIDDAVRQGLLAAISQVVEEEQIDMTFTQALQAAERCQLRLLQERGIYEYFNKVIHGNAAINDITIATDATDEQGRPIVARIPLIEVLASEIADDEKRAESIRPFFAMINNYYAKRVAQWVREIAVYSTVAATKMPSQKS